MFQEYFTSHMQDMLWSFLALISMVAAYTAYASNTVYYDDDHQDQVAVNVVFLNAGLWIFLFWSMIETLPVNRILGWVLWSMLEYAVSYVAVSTLCRVIQKRDR